MADEDEQVEVSVICLLFLVFLGLCRLLTAFKSSLCRLLTAIIIKYVYRL